MPSPLSQLDFLSRWGIYLVRLQSKMPRIRHLGVSRLATTNQIEGDEVNDDGLLYVCKHPIACHSKCLESEFICCDACFFCLASLARRHGSTTN